MGGLRVDDAPIESAAAVSATFEAETGFGGIMGLAKRLNNRIEPPEPTFLLLLRRQLEAPVFTANLRANASGRFDFGRVDGALASDAVTWLRGSAASPHWSVELDRTGWTGRRGGWVRHRFAAIVDTGTSMLFLPDALAARYWAAGPRARAGPAAPAAAYRFPCAAAPGLPDLRIKLPGSDHVVAVPGRYLDYGPTRHDPLLCWGALQSAAQLGGTAVLGDAMLKALFVAFDLETGRVGFANKHLHRA